MFASIAAGTFKFSKHFLRTATTYLSLAARKAIGGEEFQVRADAG